MLSVAFQQAPEVEEAEARRIASVAWQQQEAKTAREAVEAMSFRTFVDVAFGVAVLFVYDKRTLGCRLRGTCHFYTVPIWLVRLCIWLGRQYRGSCFGRRSVHNVTLVVGLQSLTFGNGDAATELRGGDFRV